MTGLPLDRRQLLKGASLGMSLAALPTIAVAARASGFTHGVASGEPSSSSVLLWARFVGAHDTRLVVEMSETLDFAKVVAGGEAIASPEADWCAKAVVGGLAPWCSYYYRFVAPDGSVSPIGRTRTLPDALVPSFAIGAFSCSNIGFGYFNAYAHAVQADDLDLVMHLGDYSYEYGPGVYPDAGELVDGRLPAPIHETIRLADYRVRYASYRRDPALQRLHQLFPFVMMWDDHESANDSWHGGAQGHGEGEGDWQVRKRAAMRAYHEWMPVSDESWRSYDIGELATLFLPETRLTGRSQGLAHPDPRDRLALEAFVAALADPARTMMGAEQEAWLASGLASSARSGRRWQVIANQVPMGTTIPVPALADTLPASAPAELQRFVTGLAAMGRLGLPANLDLWDGYPAARARLLGAALEAGANLVSLSGDVHNAYAYDLGHAGQPAGCDFACTSVTAPGNEARFAWLAPDVIERESVAFNPGLRWHDAQQRGYMRVTLRPERVEVEHRFTKAVRHPSSALLGTARQQVERGANAISA